MVRSKPLDMKISAIDCLPWKDKDDAGSNYSHFCETTQVKSIDESALIEFQEKLESLDDDSFIENRLAKKLIVISKSISIETFDEQISELKSIVYELIDTLYYLRQRMEVEREFELHDLFLSKRARFVEKLLWASKRAIKRL